LILRKEERWEPFPQQVEGIEDIVTIASNSCQSIAWLVDSKFKEIRDTEEV